MGSGDKWLLRYQILVETLFHHLLLLMPQHLSYISINKTIINKTLINVFMGICYWDNAMFIITFKILFHFANYYPNILEMLEHILLYNISIRSKLAGLRVQFSASPFMWFMHRHSQHTIFLFNLLMMEDLTFDIPLEKVFVKHCSAPRVHRG